MLNQKGVRMVALTDSNPTTTQPYHLSVSIICYGQNRCKSVICYQFNMPTHSYCLPLHTCSLVCWEEKLCGANVKSITQQPARHLNTLRHTNYNPSPHMAVCSLYSLSVLYNLHAVLYIYTVKCGVNMILSQSTLFF